MAGVLFIFWTSLFFFSSVCQNVIHIKLQFFIWSHHRYLWAFCTLDFVFRVCVKFCLISQFHNNTSDDFPSFHTVLLSHQSNRVRWKAMKIHAEQKRSPAQRQPSYIFPPFLILSFRIGLWHQKMLFSTMPLRAIDYLLHRMRYILFCCVPCTSIPT